MIKKFLRVLTDIQYKQKLHVLAYFKVKYFGLVRGLIE